ncbi:MAG: NAD(P)/FAD-dependent oxidoreductase [Candidatus Hydrogenedentes bacterium]|nr:NAD(P)/FAD-dependent oxidoreductase [Candidatus Hydrogenedentota bacterium]
MKIGIIGAGISGLSTALALARRGHEVHVFQREHAVGGLIATFDFGGIPIEHFYHFLCTADRGYFNLCKELGIGDRLRFKKASTGFYYEGRLFNMNSPLDLLRFSPIPFTQRIRFGLFALEARARTEWVQLDELTAKPWLIDRIGKQTYDVVWHPLLALKFGAFHDRISAAWMWHRIHRVAKCKGRMGYLEGGTALLLDTLLRGLKDAGVTIHPGQPVTGILADENRVQGLRFEGAADFACDRVVSTVPLSVLARLLPPHWEAYAKDLRRVDYIGVSCLIFKLRKRVSPHFWLNVHDHRVPFNGIIEYTNLNPLDGACHLAYVPYYTALDSPFYTMEETELTLKSWEALKLLAPQLGDADLIDHHLARTPFAQAICPTGFLNIVPDMNAPIGGLHVLDSTLLYPEDRTQSGHILKGEACANAIHGGAPDSGSG